MEELKYGIDIEKSRLKTWSFGGCISHTEEEFYVFINFFKYTITIGKFFKYIEYDEEYYPNCITISDSNKSTFDDKLNKYLQCGYKISSSSCNSKEYKAILVKY